MARTRLAPLARLLSTHNADLIALAQLALCAHAHDTWFAVRAAALPGTLVVALGTGNQFPRQEFPVDSEHLQEQGCRQAGQAIALAAIAKASTALLLQAKAPSGAAVTCWSQLVRFEIELAPDKIGPYLDEINASPRLVESWAAMRTRGLRWRERYVKSARVEIAAGTDGDTPAPAANRVPMEMDVLLQSGLQRLHPGEALVVQVLRDGLPLPDFPIELRGAGPGWARWFKTDAQGRVSTGAPEPGKWVWRGTDLRLSTTDIDVWESRFVTLSFEVHAPPSSAR